MCINCNKKLEGWGYCRWCKRLEPIDPKGLLVPHKPHWGDHRKEVQPMDCTGSGKPPAKQPAKDVKP